MKKLTLVFAVTLFLAAGFSDIANGDLVGDFRIGAAVYTADTALDPGADNLTRLVVGAPVDIISNLSVASQNIGVTVPNSEDVAMRTFSSVTRLRNLSRFTPSTGTGGVQRIGVAQWNFDLTPLDTYLSSNNLALDVLDLDLDTVHSDGAKKTDLYLSYTNPAESIAIQSIENAAIGDDNDNWTNFYLPARSSSAGSIVNGTHKILALDSTGNYNLNESLLTLYNSGVREFNLVLAAGDFWSARNIDIAAGSGLSIETSVIAVPEPTSMSLLALAGLVAFSNRRRVA